MSRITSNKRNIGANSNRWISHVIVFKCRFIHALTFGYLSILCIDAESKAVMKLDLNERKFAKEIALI